MTGNKHILKEPRSFDAQMSTNVSTTLLCWLLIWTAATRCMGGGGGTVDAWPLIPHDNHNTRMTKRTVSSGFLTMTSPRNRDNNKVSTEASCALRRLAIQGVSVSENGFVVVWGLSNTERERVYWPWQVTTPQAGDQREVTSAQALTLCQLVAGIDLAGSRLPVDILAQVTVLTCERERRTMTDQRHGSMMDRLITDVQQQVRDIRRQWFPNATSTENLAYTDASQWIRARVRLPICTLDQIVVEPVGTQNESPQVSFHIKAKDYGSLVLKHVTDDVLEDIFEHLYDDRTFSEETRRAFLTAALSLRYKAPVLMERSQNEDNLFIKDIRQAFPLYQTVQKVQTPSDRVVSRIEEGWEIHQLQAAYQIALKKNDMTAVAKIRAKLDEMERMEDLPVQEDSELDSMQ